MKPGLTAALLALALALAASPEARAQAPQPPELAARQYVLIDMASQQVLAQHNAQAQVDPGSLAKLMTAYLVFDALRDKRLGLEQTLPVSALAWAQRKSGAAVMFIDAKQPPTVSELLRGLIVLDANDAAIALAEGVAGSSEGFVAQMNLRAQAWGLHDTQFVNPTGAAASGQRSSAHDLAQVAMRIVREHPDFYPLYGVRQYTYSHIRQDSANTLLARDATVDGLAAASSDLAGHGLVASALRQTPAGARRLLSVVLGTASRDARAGESQKLLNWGWQAWDAVRLFEAAQAVAQVPVWQGDKAQARLGAPGALVVTVPRGEGARLRTSVERSDPLLAPLAQGQRVGTIHITTSAGTSVADVPLVVLEPVGLAGLLGRAWDALRLWIK
jgi:D-alanyl-D-alanine carboxypeptidase (penicillin-binding protein 5/6)